ncbi:MAG: glycosyltransferase [Actinomycetes bacterium]
MTARPQLSIVIPAFNEATRLPRTLAALRAHFGDGRDVEVVVVDDGSRDETAEVARAGTGPGWRLVVEVLPENRGKGAAVRAGVALTTGEVVLVMDADLATDLAAVAPALALLAGADLVVGSRAVPGSTVAGTTALRTVMGRTFNGLVRLIARLDVHDSQCGFKAFRGDVARLLFAMSEVDGFAYDPEVLVLARILGYTTVELAVAWTAVDGSTVRPLRDSLATGVALLRIVARRHPARVRAEAGRLGWSPVASSA